jgi:predicted amidophosphoribosyltransferase
MGWWEDVIDLVVGARCAACQSTALGLCADCSAAIRPRPCIVRDRPCRVAAGGLYEGALRDAVIAWKERGRFTVERPLAHLLAAAVLALDVDGPVAMVPIPSRPDRRRARGTDVVADLTRRSARLLRSVDVDATAVPSLEFVKRVRDQAGLSAAARAANMRGSFAARRRPAPPIVLVDDIVTTGATLSEAVRAFQTLGVAVAGAAVIADRPRMTPS